MKHRDRDLMAIQNKTTRLIGKDIRPDPTLPMPPFQIDGLRTIEIPNL
jgi:hypothetical protein